MESTYLKELFLTTAMLFLIWGMEKWSDQELYSQHVCLCHFAENWAGTIFWGQISSQRKDQNILKKTHVLMLQFCEFQMQQHHVLCQIHCQNF